MSAPLDGRELHALARDLRAAGLGRELRDALREAARPMAVEARLALLDRLPTRGGMGPLMASTVRVSTKAVGGTRAPGIVVEATATKRGPGRRRHLRQLDETGTWRHPRWRRASRWVVQSVAPGWWTDTMTRETTREVPRRVEDAITTVARRIRGG